MFYIGLSKFFIAVAAITALILIAGGALWLWWHIHRRNRKKQS
jgi:hypothetical protein